MKYFLLLLPLVVSCSKSTEEAVEEAISTAKIYLTNSNCNKGIETLEIIGRQNDNIEYLMTLASAYACKARFTEPTFYGVNLSRITASQTGFFGSLTTFTSSEMTSPTDGEFVALQTAIDVLLYAGGISNSSTTERARNFDATAVQDLELQNLYMIITQLGKYFYYYGNVDPTNGTKGAGSEGNGNSNNLSNGCLYDYDPADGDLATAMAAGRVAGVLGACTDSASGHEQLVALPNTNTVERMCQAIILFNNFLDIISSISIPGSADSLEELNTLFNDACSSVSQAGSICSVKDQSVCEVDFAESPNTDRLQVYFYFIFETLFI